jgi:asparaginyl-tRNA synthetase
MLLVLNSWLSSGSIVKYFKITYVTGVRVVHQVWEPISQSQVKKIKKIWVREQHKFADKSKKEADDAAKRDANLEEARKVVIEQDPALPAAVQVKIRDLETYRGVRVKV